MNAEKLLAKVALVIVMAIASNVEIFVLITASALVVVLTVLTADVVKQRSQVIRVVMIMVMIVQPDRFVIL